MPDATTALRKLCRARKDLVAARVVVASQLRAHLATALPAAVGLFADIDSAIGLRFLARFTTQDAFDWLSPKRLATWLASASYGGRADPAVLHQKITTAPSGPAGDHGQALARHASAVCRLRADDLATAVKRDGQGSNS